MLQNKRILLIIGGGIAAYKCLDLIRRLRERGARVRCILTKGGAEFVTPLSVASLSEEKVYTELFSLTDEAEMGHIRLSREADVILVAPATANLIARMSGGQADDLATTALLATDKPVMIAPTMNTRMWTHAATQRNLATLRKDGVRIIVPTAGELACGEVGEGRLAEVPQIIEALDQFFGMDQPLKGKKAIVTAGPTREAIDPVRYIANRSSGKQGYAIAAALTALGANTTLISGPTEIEPPSGPVFIPVESARDMLAACEMHLPADIAVCVAAVSDWRAEQSADQKIKKNGGAPPALNLVENPDILFTLSAPGKMRPRLVIGFAAETENIIRHAQAKLSKKGCDWIIANDVSGGEAGVMGADHNQVHVITPGDHEEWARAGKDEVARRLALKIAEYFKE